MAFPKFVALLDIVGAYLNLLTGIIEFVYGCPFPGVLTRSQIKLYTLPFYDFSAYVIETLSFLRLPSTAQEDLRRKAVQAVLDGGEVKHTAKLFGIIRQALHKWYGYIM